MFIPRFLKDYKASKLVVSIYKYPVYISKRILKLQYTHIVMIMMCVTCRLMYVLCIYDKWPIVVHISAPNTIEETREQGGNFHLKVGGAKSSGNAGDPMLGVAVSGGFYKRGGGIK